MIKKIFYIVSLTAVIAGALSFYLYHPKDNPPIIVQFVTRNGYGNNLYIDNISFGRKDSMDIAITSINNIPKDTTYLNSLIYTYKIAPQVNVTNLGVNNLDNDTVIMEINSVSYISVDTTGPIASGQTKVLTFDSLSIVPGTTYDIKVYIQAVDTSRNNDTLRQTSVFLTGAIRNVLAEEFTSMTSPSCAANNPYLDKYIDTNFQSICAVKYHLGIPVPGLDSMYLADSIQQNQRAGYYYVYSVPSTFLDGKLRLPLPYTFDSNITLPFYSRYIAGSPVMVNVTDTRLGGDTIQASINVNLLHTLASSNLRLRVYAIERYKKYITSPAPNGELNFFDIFRQSFTDSAGILLNNIQGSYDFVFKYHRDSTWVDSLIYTMAFVQDDNTKEVLNCGKSRTVPKGYFNFSSIKPARIYSKADFGKNIYGYNHSSKIRNTGRMVQSLFNFEGFEGPFPPNGWTVLNPDVGFTFEQLSGFNGISFGGVKCIKVPFYDYPNIGEKDTLLSIAFTNITPEDTFRFDYSYAQYLSSYIDSLVVSMSTDNGQTFRPVFAEGGPHMATSQATTLSYAPSASTQWVTYHYPMSSILTLNPVKPVPATYKLYQNYPNPFNPKTTIKFDLPHTVNVTIKIYDLLGREIVTLLNDKVNAGSHTVEFTPTNLASGIYFYRLVAGDYTEVKKMALIK